jgi:hypothetical protein
MNININGLDVSDNINYLVESFDYRSPAERHVYTQATARHPGDKVVGLEWSNKTIKMAGRIFGNTPDDLNTALDTFELTLGAPQLTITVDSARSYTGVLSKLEIPNQFYNLSMLQYSAEFLCVDPFAYGSLLSVSGTTVSGTLTYSGSMTVSGTVFAEPTLTLNPTGALAGNSGLQGVTITHVPSGETITVSGVINYLSPLAINYSSFMITNSGVLNDFTGIFSRFEPGVNQFTITVISGTRQGYLWKWQYSPRYLQ